jgi:hypothetical protein
MLVAIALLSALLTVVPLMTLRPRTQRIMQQLWRDHVIDAPHQPAPDLERLQQNLQRGVWLDLLCTLGVLTCLALAALSPAVRLPAVAFSIVLTLRTTVSATQLYLRAHRMTREDFVRLLPRMPASTQP